MTTARTVCPDTRQPTRLTFPLSLTNWGYFDVRLPLTHDEWAQLHALLNAMHSALVEHAAPAGGTEEQQ